MGSQGHQKSSGLQSQKRIICSRKMSVQSSHASVFPPVEAPVSVLTCTRTVLSTVGPLYSLRNHKSVTLVLHATSHAGIMIY